MNDTITSLLFTVSRLYSQLSINVKLKFVSHSFRESVDVITVSCVGHMKYSNSVRRRKLCFLPFDVTVDVEKSEIIIKLINANKISVKLNRSGVLQKQCCE